MSKVTSKFQVTVPKTIADKFSIRPGDRIDWIPAGDVILVVPRARQVVAQEVESRLRSFDQATDRHRQRTGRRVSMPKDRGWIRQDLYGRGRSG